MRTMRLWLITPVLGILLGFPAAANAGLMDVVWGMSGPQMVGSVVRCRTHVTDGATICNLFGVPLKGATADVMRATNRETPTNPWWVALEGGWYRSTGKNNDGRDFIAWKTEMLAFEPLLQYVWNPNARNRVFHGLGPTFQFVAGDAGAPSGAFDAFGKTGIKLRAIGAEFGDHWEVALNFRLYPNEFGADQFGYGPRPSGDRPFEWTWGFLAGYKY